MRRGALALALALLLAPAPLAGAQSGGAQRRVQDLAPAGPSVEERLAEIRRRVQRVLVYPPLARLRGLEGTTRLEFEIGADGRAREVAVAHSSGSGLLDHAAARAVVAAGELPYVWGRLSLPVRFVLADELALAGDPAQLARTP
jgi:TonB family protein